MSAGCLLLMFAPAAPPARPRAIPGEAKAGAIRLKVARVSWQRSGRLILGPSARPLPGSRQISAGATVDLNLVASSPDALESIAAEIVGYGKAFEAVDDTGRRARSVRAEIRQLEDGSQLRLTVDGISPGAHTLTRITGALPAYPRAQRIRFHVPWLKDEVPLSVDFGGGKATLEHFQLVEDNSTLWVRVHPPEGYRVAALQRAGALTARAMDIDGNLVNGGGVTEIEQTAGGDSPQFRFYAPGLRRTPSRLMLDVLFVSGVPRWTPFRIGPISLPQPR